MGIEIVFKITGIGILIAIICQLLKQTGRDDMAMLAALAGLIITLMMVVDLIRTLFDSVKQIFQLLLIHLPYHLLRQRCLRQMQPLEMLYEHFLAFALMY